MREEEGCKFCTLKGKTVFCRISDHSVWEVTEKRVWGFFGAFFPLDGFVRLSENLSRFNEINPKIYLNYLTCKQNKCKYKVYFWITE